MDTKLTLKLNQQIIEKAKKYASFNNTSLSDLIENYLDKLTSEKENSITISPLVKSLSGVISLPKKHNEREEYADYLSDKYK